MIKRYLLKAFTAFKGGPFLKNYTDFIDVTLSDFSNDTDIKYTLDDFKKKRKAG